MEDITAVEDGKPAVEGEKRRKLLIGITSFSILLGFIMMVMGCIMLSQYSVFLDFVTTRYTETAVFLLVIGLLTMAVSGTGGLIPHQSMRRRGSRDHAYCLLYILLFVFEHFCRPLCSCDATLLPDDGVFGCDGGSGGDGGPSLRHILCP